MFFYVSPINMTIIQMIKCTLYYSGKGLYEYDMEIY